MNKKILIATSILLAAIQGCSSTQSIVVSSKADFKNAQAGIAYSLPKQLVKVTYTRTILKEAEEKKKRDNAEKALNSVIEKLANKSEEEDAKKALIKSVDPKIANRAQVIAKLNLELTQIMAEKLLLTSSLANKKKALIAANEKYSLALETDKAYAETFNISPQSPIADADHTFYANIDHSFAYSDEMDITLKNGLLEGSIGHSEDKSADIAVSFIGGLSGLAGAAPITSVMSKLEMRSSLDPSINKDDDKEVCTKKGTIIVSQVIDPNISNDLARLNKQLEAGCLSINISSEASISKTDNLFVKTESDTQPYKANGLLYRQPGIFNFKVFGLGEKKDKNTYKTTELQVIRLSLSQGGPIGLISMPKGRFSKNEYNVKFSAGSLVKNKTIQPSELLGVAMLLPNALRAVFAIPTELLQLKIDYSSKEKESIELQKSILDAQLSLSKAQTEMETSNVFD